MDRDKEYDLARGVAKRYGTLDLIITMWTVKYLFQHANNLDAWLGFMMTSRNAFQRSLQKQIDKHIKPVVEAEKWAYDKESEEWNKTLNETGEIPPLPIPDEVSIIRKKAIQSYDNVLNDIVSQVGTNNLPVANSGLATEPLYRQLSRSISRRVPTYVTYSNGRQVPYRTYIEMKLRTDMANKSTQKILDNEEIELYQATYFYDSADDHREAQGKVYCKAKFKDKYPQLTTVEEITGDPVYLTTRPNCRHTLEPIKSLKDAKHYKKRTNKEEEVAYKKRELERKIEHEIRMLDMSIAMLEEEIRLAKGEDLISLKAQLQSNKQKRSALQKKWLDLVTDSKELFEYYNL